MAIEVEVLTAPPILLEVFQAVNSIEVSSAPGLTVEVGNGAMQQNLWVTETNPGFSSPGIWVQTNINGVPEDFTIWIEDGT